MSVPPLPPLSAGSLAGFLAIVVALCVGLVLAVRHVSPPEARRRWTVNAAVGVIAWVGVWSALALGGFWRGADPNAFPPRLMLFFVGSNLGAVVLALSPVGRRLAQRLPLGWLVGFQAFRLPLELVLWAWADSGVIPNSMSLHGRNPDIITGVLALMLGLWALRGPLPRAAVWGFEVVGLALLLNVGYTAIRAAPGPFNAGVEAPLLLGYDFPTTLIVPVCVAGALAGHLVLLRALWAGRPSAA